MKQLDRFLYENQKRIRLDTIETAAFWCYNTIKRGGETVQNNENNLSKEHILVCLSSSPSNERIVRMAGKMAQAFCGSLTALYVQTPGYSGMNAEDIARLQANIRLAQQLGAEIITTHGEDVPTQIAEYARLSDVTKIVIGRSGVQRRHFWSEPTLTEQLITLAPEMDIHIIPDAEVYKSYPRKPLFAVRPALPTARELLLTVGILTDHRMVVSAAWLCGCQYHHGLSAGCASDLRFYQRIYLRRAVRLFECHLVQLFSDRTQAVFGRLWKQISHNLCRHVHGCAFDRYTCSQAQSPRAAIRTGRLSHKAAF